MRDSGFADKRSETSPVSEDIEPAILSGITAKLSERKANSKRTQPDSKPFSEFAKKNKVFPQTPNGNQLLLFEYKSWGKSLLL